MTDTSRSPKQPMPRATKNVLRRAAKEIIAYRNNLFFGWENLSGPHEGKVTEPQAKADIARMDRLLADIEVLND